MKIAIITARGGSKRIPKKNIRDFCGKPIMAYSIEAAISSRIFDTVMVSTDSKEIANIAKQYGADIPFMRSDETSNDFATTSDVLIEVLEKYKEQGIVYTQACCLYPTAPFVTSERLKEAMSLLNSSNEVDTVIPILRYSYPPQRGLISKDGYIKMREPEFSRTRSQDLQPIYHDAGQFYCFDVKAFLKTKNIMAGKIKGVELSELEVQDIDTIEDWKIAEMKYKLLKK